MSETNECPYCRARKAVVKNGYRYGCGSDLIDSAFYRSPECYKVENKNLTNWQERALAEFKNLVSPDLLARTAIGCTSVGHLVNEGAGMVAARTRGE